MAAPTVCESRDAATDTGDKMPNYAEREILGRVNEHPLRGASLLGQVAECLGIPDSVFKHPETGIWQYSVGESRYEEIPEEERATIAILDCAVAVDEYCIGGNQAALETMAESINGATAAGKSLTMGPADYAFGELETALSKGVEETYKEATQAINPALNSMQEAWDQTAALWGAEEELELDEETNAEIQAVRVDIARLLGEIETEHIPELEKVTARTASKTAALKEQAQVTVEESLASGETSSVRRRLKKAAEKAASRDSKKKPAGSNQQGM